MAETVVLKTQPRDQFGSANAKRLRKQGLVPAVLYGHKEEHLSVVLSAEEFENAFRHGVRVLELDTGAKKETARIRELQWDHLGKEVVHIDFMRVSKDERIVVNVPVQLRGIAPGVGPGAIDVGAARRNLCSLDAGRSSPGVDRERALPVTGWGRPFAERGRHGGLVHHAG